MYRLILSSPTGTSKSRSYQPTLRGYRSAIRAAIKHIETFPDGDAVLYGHDINERFTRNNMPELD